ncbi:MAG: MFS transporter [Bacteroidales bacterium]
MVKKTIRFYINAFSGFSKEVWWLTLVTFINRAGTMVIPFLSLYLINHLKFNLEQVGWIMSSFGIGSFAGSWLGGKLTDKFGFYKVMFLSLLSTGFLFIALQFIQSFWAFLAAIFLTMCVADAFRPAIFVALKIYSKSENQTRSISLIRLAINLGFAFGPFLGGLIIAFLSYNGLFWVDGLTCIIANIIFRIVLKEKKADKNLVDLKQISESGNRSAFLDKPYLLFLLISFLMAFTFMQLFSTIPLFYKEAHKLNEISIGLLMSINGGLIFIIEMPFIHFLERKAFNQVKLIMMSLLLIGCSFLIFNLTSWSGILIISMVIITIAEMFGFPFSNVFALNRAPEGHEGQYMSLFTMSFSLANIFGSKIGLKIVEVYGFATNWNLMGSLNIVAFLLGIWLIRELRKQGSG